MDLMGFDGFQGLHFRKVTDLAECKTYSTYTGSSFWQCLNSTLEADEGWKLQKVSGVESGGV